MFIEIDGWMAKMRFSACHFIPRHHRCGCLHGHTYAVSVRIEGEQKGEFIIDFEIVKHVVNNICNTLDHKILIAENDSRLDIQKDHDNIYIRVDKKQYVFPKEDVVLLPITSVSAEDLCKYFTEKIAEELRGLNNLKKIHVRLDEGIGQGAGCELEL